MKTRSRVLTSLVFSALLLPACADPQRAVLIRSQEEPAGENCASGGSALRAGRDANGDGTLTDDEIETTTYVCRPSAGRTGTTISGSVSIWNQDDIDAIAGVTTITGDLVLEADNVAVLSFPDLVSVEGTIRATGVSDVETLALAKLTTAGEIEVASEEFEDGHSVPGIERLELPVLTTVDHLYAVLGAGILLPELTEAGVLDVGFPALEAAGVSVSLPKLVEVSDSLSIASSGEPIDIALPVLTTVGSLQIGNGDAVSVPELVSVNGSLSVSARGALALPKVGSVPGGLTLAGELTSLSLPVLTSAGSLVVNTGTLPSVTIPMLASITGTGPSALASFRLAGAVSLPALTSIPGPLTFGAGVTSVSAPLLATVTGALTLSGTALTTFGLPVLSTLGTLNVATNVSLSSLSLPMLEKPTSTSAVFFNQNPAFSECSIEALETAWDTAGWGGNISSSGNLACP